MLLAAVLRGGTDPAVIVATLAFCTLATLFFALGPALKLTLFGVNYFFLAPT